MMSSTSCPSPEVLIDAEAGSLEPPWRRLMHRWFVQYNPLYLLSAALVLCGATLISRGFAQQGSVQGGLVAAAIAELYACLLIAGAAFLTRLGLRRPAVMLALLAVTFQGDLALSTLTSSQLGWMGALTSLAWIALFIARLRALAWAVRLRLSSSVVLIAALGALGLALLPRCVAHGSAACSAFVALWVFAVFALRLWSEPTICSKVGLDGWGQTVLRRSVRATWLIWAAVLLGHVAFWVLVLRLDPAVLVPVAPLLATRFIRREPRIWATVGLTLLLVAGWMPGSFWVSALMASVALGLFALRRPSVAAPSGETVPERGMPYRTPELLSPQATPPGIRFVRANRASLVRLLTGSLVAVYLAMWTYGWSGGPWPLHITLLDGLMAAAALLAASSLGVRIVFVPVVATYLHLAVERGIITSPRSTLGWGATSAAMGFAVTFISLMVSWLMARHAPPRRDH
jgi:hypothetical protein